MNEENRSKIKFDGVGIDVGSNPAGPTKALIMQSTFCRKGELMFRNLDTT